MNLVRRQIIDLRLPGVPADHDAVKAFSAIRESLRGANELFPFVTLCKCLEQFALVDPSVVDSGTISGQVWNVRTQLTNQVRNGAAFSKIVDGAGVDRASLLSMLDWTPAYGPGGVRPEPVPVHPPQQVPVAAYRNQQRYLDATGVNVSGAAGEPRSRVTLVDVEQGWNLSHREFEHLRIRRIGNHEGRFHGHGTSVLGILVGNLGDRRGIDGIMPDHLEVGVASQYGRTTKNNDGYSTALAILAALAEKDFLKSGDILLIQAQHFDETTGLILPVEADPLVRCVIECAVRHRKLVVIEAAGNGGVDLESVTLSGKRPFDFADKSGAIVVGASTSDEEHEALFFSNRGRYVDCYAWGENVTTCGDGETSQENDDYISDFGGTSAAAAIVAGVAALTQSVARALNFGLSGEELRALLVDPELGTSTTKRSAPIGVMPDVPKIIAKVKQDALNAAAAAAVEPQPSAPLDKSTKRGTKNK